ncbi:MAG: helix-turn-helix transcriptional regulator [Vicinamibacterales bacterium]
MPVQPLWELSDVIRKLRKQRGWSQADLAERAGVHKTTVIALESPGTKETPKLETVQKVAAALDVTQAVLWGYVEYQQPTPEDFAVLNVSRALEAERRARWLQAGELSLRQQRAAEASRPATPEAPADHPPVVVAPSIGSRRRRR